MKKIFAVYILSSKRNGTLYIAQLIERKDWKRKWKLELIEKQNPQWRDLYDDISG